MPYVDRPLPETLELPRIAPLRPRDKRLDNLRYGPGIGRRKGAQDKICRDLKQGLIEGAVLHGYDGAGEDGLIGYCHHLAERHPKAYCGLLAKLLPFNMNANVATAAINEVRIVSVPSDHYVTGAVDASGAPMVEHIPPQQQLVAPAEHSAPQTERERRLLAELESLSHEELEERARQAGFFDADTD